MIPLAVLPPEPVTYPTVELCATAALEDARTATAHRSPQVEYGGVLVSDGTVCTYTVPATTGEENHFSVHAVIPAPWRIIGIYHTHPHECVPRFSPEDIDVAKKLHLPSRIIGTDCHNIRLFTPR